jgi:Uma2 family endonuclease
MKAVMPEVPEFVCQWRKTTGSDRFDEMWDGVLHMPTTPSRLQQDFEAALETWLRAHWVPVSRGKVYHQINVCASGKWPNNYRIPDLILLMPERFCVDRNEYFDGAPSAVVEIRSPNDETYEKLPFYAGIGVPEVWVIDRDTKWPELYELVGSEYAAQQPDAGGWLTSRLGVQFRCKAEGKLLIRRWDAEQTLSALPDDL